MQPVGWVKVGWQRGRGSCAQLELLITRLNCRSSPAVPLALAKVIRLPGFTVAVVRCRLSRAEGGSCSPATTSGMFSTPRHMYQNAEEPTSSVSVILTDLPKGTRYVLYLE
eukprot:SAG11_NODE_217_length_12229_cov_9.152185_9_plen_111_part_00